MNTFYDICTKSTYKDRQTGEDKATWPKVGKLIQTADGKFILDIPLLPKLYVFPQKEHNAAVKTANAESGGGARWPEPTADFQDDDIPFVTNGGMF